MKIFKYLLVVFAFMLAAVPVASFAEYPTGRFEIGAGFMREGDGMSNYHIIEGSYAPFQWWGSHRVAVVGGMLLGSPARTFSLTKGWNTNPDVSDRFIGVQYQEWDKWLVGGLGIIRVSRETADLTSKYQFYLTFGVHLDNWSVSYRHISNGQILAHGANNTNNGEDLLVLGYSF